MERTVVRCIYARICHCLVTSRSVDIYRSHAARHCRLGHYWLFIGAGHPSLRRRTWVGRLPSQDFTPCCHFFHMAVQCSIQVIFLFAFNEGSELAFTFDIAADAGDRGGFAFMTSPRWIGARWFSKPFLNTDADGLSSSLLGCSQL